MTRKENHTPGPWEFLEADDPNGEFNACRPLTISGGGDDLAHVFSADDATVDISRDEAIANAHLIARAPALLDENTKLRAEAVRLRAALAFYANHAAYRTCTVYMSGVRPETAINQDGGDKARDALSKAEG